ncbi:protein JASON-like [Abrus precatorius]|uniref:Protein JASON-like n=1 Tax=Abrus precatorius TaxID=3816 RepID=A0A8B8K9F0_ABRPR|nr:protein JASON-like [Abrus precatorius]XP_027339814.1 protein JASON-like [Abrus precatorius]
MGCFFACFRARDSTTATVPSSCPNNPKDVEVSRNRLSTLFLSEEREEAVREDGKNFEVGSQKDDKGFKDEAKVLKPLSTVSKTPAEKVQLNCEPFNPPTPIKHCEEWGKRTDSLEHTPSSCISNANSTQCDSLDSTEGIRTGNLHALDRNDKNTASVSPWPSTTYTKRRNKSVRFECDTDLSSCDSSDYGGWNMKKTESPNNENAYKPSPYPTPMKLSDEMQTPGTVYPATREDLLNGKPRVKSQFVYPIYSPGDAVSQNKILEEEDHISEQDSRKLSESVERSQVTTSTPEKALKKMSYDSESKVEESLSSWLKPAAVILEERNKRLEIAYNQIRKTPAERPIIGMVAAHWNEDEDSQVPPPKWWDGNGIPNSTNKYKEDQKVNWHATPFEERLEKALSEETFITQRKDACGQPIPFDENEESDTALSQLQSSNHPQSVVSF